MTDNGYRIASTELRAPHALYNTEQDRHMLRTRLIHFGNTCAAFCESLEVLNDVHIIFLYQTFQFQSVFYGDQSMLAPLLARVGDGLTALQASRPGVD